jgi:hypothetical protein
MRNRLAVVPLVALAFAACTDVTSPVEAPEANLSGHLGVTTERGIAPSEYPGNFVASDDDQVCYELAALGYITEVTSEMWGFKVDPPMSYGEGGVDFTLQANGRYLDWESTPPAEVLAVVVKGGPNFNVFDYVGTDHEWDNDLFSPLHRGRLPAISHYNVCYIPTGGEGEGCTPGYWRNHADRWVGVAPDDDFDTTFGVDLFDPNVTLGWAIWASGGGNNAFARHATAALLNAHAKATGSNGQFVDYAYTVAEVIQMVQDAVANETIEATKDLFEAANEAGCPLSGTSAVPVVP